MRIRWGFMGCPRPYVYEPTSSESMDKRDGFVETGVLTVVVIGHSSIHEGALVTCSPIAKASGKFLTAVPEILVACNFFLFIQNST
jgi:hypothetical protein